LFLDDDEQRQTHAMKEFIGHDAHHVRTAEEAIARLKANTYDVAMLDHDLGGTHYAPSDEKSGYQVAVAIEKRDVPAPGLVVVHSYNAAGAVRMVQALANSGVPCVWAPFGPSAFKTALQEVA
jgi:ActR/RegA family two-component response regulator